MGTPFIWSTLFVLTIGNVIIALVESSILARKFGCRPEASFGIMLGANFLTAGIGFVCLPWFTGLWQRLSLIDHIRAALPTLVLAWIYTFLLTAIIEAGVLSIMSRRMGLKVHPWRASVWVNLASYICLILIASATGRYGGALHLKSRTIWTKMTRPMPRFDLWYVRPDGTTVTRFKMEPFDPSKGKLEIDDYRDPRWPQIRPSQKLNSPQALAVVTSPTGIRYLKFLSTTPADSPTLIKDFDPKATLERTREVKGWQARGLYPIGAARSLDHSKKPRFLASTELWPGYDFEVTDNQTGERYSFGLETPFFQWRWGNLIQLPDGWCIAEKGGRIYLVDLKLKQIGWLADGFGATAVIPGNLK